MRSLLSRLAFLWAALAVSLCLLLPIPLGTWVAALAVAAAAVSLLVGRGGKAARADDAGPPPASAIEEAGLLDTAAMVVRSAAHAHDLPTALHGVARILFQQLGADGVVTGRLDESGALVQLDRFADPAVRRPVPSRESMSGVATEATRFQRVVADAATGYAVPVLRAGRTLAWLEFKSFELDIGNHALVRLLDLVRLELSAVAERGVWPNSGQPVAVNRPLPMAHRPAAEDKSTVLDRAAVQRLRQLDPNGVNRLLERVTRAFEASATRLIPQLRKGALGGDLEGVRQAAQTLRSASASIGAATLSRLCADVETELRTDDPDGLIRQVQAVIDEIDRVLSTLRGLPVTAE